MSLKVDNAANKGVKALKMALPPLANVLFQICITTVYIVISLNGRKIVKKLIKIYT